MDVSLVTWIIIITVSFILLIILLRGFVNWYFKINENIRLLTEANKLHSQNRDLLVKLYQQQGGQLEDLQEILQEIKENC